MTEDRKPTDFRTAVVAFLLLTGVPTVVQLAIIRPWLTPITVNGGLFLLVLNTILGLMMCNYALCVFSDPGKVKEGWEPPGLGMFGELPDTSLNADGTALINVPSFCTICNSFKPERTHHCRRCGRCVLRMDHHCEWLNTCIGHANHGHFIRFLVFLLLSCISLIFSVFARLVDLAIEAKRLREGPAPDDAPVISVLEALIIAANMMILIPVTSIICVLFSEQMRMLLRNETTIESLRAKDDNFLHPDVVVPSRYHLGTWSRNVSAVLGETSFLWWLPQRMRGDGHTIESSSDGSLPLHILSSKRGS
ncbi:DHHC palmitoyltransferase-domain-containing protein [Phlyctochytrium arcticum]|nr:DHHC palmitoyltransferase-domain-containing protein [Phlyctochytrium arcticum]